MKTFIRFIGITAFLMLLSSQASSHDFWLKPAKFRVEQASNIPVQFRIGHKDSAEPWGLRWDRVVSIRQYHSTGVTDMSSTLVPSGNLTQGIATANIEEDGTIIIGFESYHSVSVLGPEKFNSYLETEGLDHIIEFRNQNGSFEDAGTEIYSRKAKAMIQSGSNITDNALKPIGQTLEIVPLDHPYDLGSSNEIRVQVLYKGKALANSKIKLVSLTDETFADQFMRTNNQGIATFKINDTGEWRFNTVWSMPLNGNNRADFETYFSSLTIGY